ncbi:efflux RND transporter periplasmic adaptor subunit [Paraglaciecola aquimarina]|uniref:Efflux RND transporter periplasmic adaptor subunit n=1 Tax=Paraglaciecola algarum TaxID=3050085 RepID=A0ABS9DBX5_9ALTE|nr:efflux RND transporter periplasmic adaptor subunit [Paraglaciecola sp. G1-23]MCF2950335.1 efflux RND transporter periplasmic adaptor subunit [Paraglaciecola sp. G1-23]
MRTFTFNILLVVSLSYALTSYANSLNVEVVTPKLQAKNLELELSGNVVALNDAQLTSLESGVVNTILVDAGDHVEQGQALVKLDDALAVIELSQAQAELQSAMVRYQEDQRLYEEVVGLTKQKVVAKTLLAERKANLANSQAMLAQVKAKLKLQQEIVKRHVLLAPFAGTISHRNVDVGEWISQQNNILRLVSDDALRIYVDIPQEYFDQINSASSIDALVTPDTLSSDPMNLTVSKFIKVSNLSSRTFQARIDLPKSTKLVAGMSARVKLVLPTPMASQVSLPKSALKRHPDGSYSVYSVQNNKIKRLSIKLLSSSFDQVIVQGVDQAAVIVVSGSELLKEGTPVTTTQSSETN